MSSNTPTIAEMNKVICEFLGWEFKKDPKFEYMAYFEGQQMWCDNLIGLNRMFLEGFKYHEDWNKLMPVWFKAQHIGADLDYSFKKFHESFHAGIDCQSITKCHKAVYQFIVWLNNQNKKQ
jgi:hypothetical protein